MAKRDSVEYKGTVTEYHNGCDLDGVVTLSITVQNSRDKQPPVPFSSFAGRSVRVTVTHEEE